MSVTSIKEIWRGRDGDVQASPPIINYSRIFRVITDDPYDTAAVVVTSGVPVIGNAHPQDVRATCRRVRPLQESFSPKVWIVTCLYSTEQSTAPFDNPLNEPARTRWAGEDWQRNLLRDLDDKAVVNSAGEPFESGGIDTDDSRLMSITRKNVSSVPIYFLSSFNAVNTQTFQIDGVGIGAGIAKAKPFSLSEPQERNGITYRVMEIPIVYRHDGWLTRILDAGYNELIEDPDDPNSEILTKITNPDGTDISKPALLDGTGKALPRDTANFGDEVYLDFRGFPLFDFNLFPLS